MTLDAAGQPDEIWVRWHAVPDFYDSGPRNRHYTADALTGEIRFGDGATGMIPPQGQNNIRITYRTGGGEEGNLDTGTIVELKSGVPYLDSRCHQLRAEAGGGAPVGADRAAAGTGTARAASPRPRRCRPGPGRPGRRRVPRGGQIGRDRAASSVFTSSGWHPQGAGADGRACRGRTAGQMGVVMVPDQPGLQPGRRRAWACSARSRGTCRSGARRPRICGSPGLNGSP